MVGTLLAGNHVPDQTLVTDSRPWAARACGQPAANATESAPEITPILKEFPLCKNIHMCQGYKRLPHKQTLDVENLLWEEWQGERFFFFSFFPLLFLFLISADFSKGFKSDSSDWFPCVQRGAAFGMQTAVSGRPFSSCWPHFPNPTH